jgi:hypothetical protein
MKKMYMTKSPIVMVPALMARAPPMVSRTPIAPPITCVPEPTAEVPVIVRRTLLNSRSAPSLKILS